MFFVLIQRRERGKKPYKIFHTSSFIFIWTFLFKTVYNSTEFCTKGFVSMEISVILSQMIQLFLILSLGYFLFKIDLFNKDMNRRITRLLLDVTLPATILNSVLSQTQRPSGNSVWMAFLIAGIMYLVLPVISYLLVKILHLPKEDQGMYLFMSTYGNVGFMGFPVIQAVFGADSVFYTAIFNIIFNMSCFSLGIIMIHYGSSEKSEKITLNWRALISPSTISSLAAVLIYVLDIHFPDIICSTVKSVGNVTTPLAMMLIGSTLATMNLREIFGDWHVYPFAVIRQFLLPLLLWPLLEKLIADPWLLGITFVLFIMPSANTCVLFATKYHRNEQLAAKTVFITTFLSMVTVPLLLFLCM